MMRESIRALGRLSVKRHTNLGLKSPIKILMKKMTKLYWGLNVILKNNFNKIMKKK